MEIHCDKCNRNLWDFLFWKWWVEERATIRLRYIEVPKYDEYWRKIWTKGIPWIWLPDVVCFECCSKVRNFEVDSGAYKI